jgi:hypothetical protein
MASAITALTFNDYVAQIASLAATGTGASGSLTTFSDPLLQVVLPQMLNYAELRIQRDLDLLPSQIVNSSYALTSNNPVLSITTADFVTIQTIIPTVTGTPLLPVSKEFIQNTYGYGSTPGAPFYFAPYGGDSATVGNVNQTFLIGPIPNQNYALNIVGTARMPTLYVSTGSGTNTTFISSYLPDLLLMASMIFLSGYQRNFGRQSDDPAMAVSYESQYQALLKGAMIEEYRKKFEARAWSSETISPVATPA